MSSAPVPETRRDNVSETIHGVEVVDPYRWLEDQQSPETRDWIEAQNAHTGSVLGALPYRETLLQRLGELMKIDTLTLPYSRDGRGSNSARRYFFARRGAGQDLFAIMMRQGLQGQDETLIDPHPMSPDGTTSVQLWDVSKDGGLLVYGIRRGGEDEMALRLFDVEARQDLPEELPRARYFSVSLKPDGSGLYYCRHETEGPRVYYHALGTGVDQDVTVFGQGLGPEKIITADVDEEGLTLLLTVHYGAGARRTDLYFKDLASDGPITTVVNDVDAKFYGQALGGKVFIQTDWDASHGRILHVDLASPDRDRWLEVVPEGEEVIEGFSLAGGKLFVETLRSVSSRLKIYSVGGEYQCEVELPGIGSVSGMVGQWGIDEAFFSFASFHIPSTIFRYDVRCGAQEVWARQDVPLDSSRLEVKQVRYPSKDGTEIPMFLLSRADLEPDGNRPVLLTGYGGFNASMTPGFSARAALWAEAGGVFAVPALRGGGEFGEDWHRAGMLEQKQNVFDDFIAAAEWLIANGYTNPSKLSIAGGSNGGLLVGAALTQRPELFRAVVCSYPLLDMVRYHRFLVARFWIPEYGASDDSGQFQWLHAYSPYHHVQPGVPYPAVMFVTGDADTRVDPLHARKMAALLQSATGSGRPVLLHYDTTAGHSGGRPISKEIEDRADELAFLFWQVGMG